MRTPAVAMISILTAGALALTACASSTKPSSANTTTPATTPTATATSLASLVPAAIAAKGTLIFAMDATYPPDESVAADGHTIVGFDADLAHDLANVLGLQATLTNATFDTIIPGLSSGKFDVGLSSFTDTKDREKTVDFVTYFQAGEGYYVPASSTKTFNGLASLCGAKVAVESGTTELTDAQTQSGKCTAAGKPKVDVLTFADQNGANLAVSSGRADVGFVDSQVAGNIVKQSNGQFVLTGTAFEVAPYGIALPKGNGMAQAMLAAMKELISNGTYSALLAKWGVQSGAITTPVIDGAIS